ncbi:hypothetical protein [Conyzicola sp.]|uniref:hypothetical protein n=1 Tax=Conyzicola sp. TaxID=1969404 RepID=UPI003988F9C6
MALTDDEIIRARRVLDLVSPTEVIRWASNQLAGGRGEPGLVDLAATYDHSADVVDRLLDQLLSASGLERPDEGRAALFVAYAIARDIVNNNVAASQGAHQIAFLNRWQQDDPGIWGFVGLADDWDDVPHLDWDRRQSLKARLEQETRMSAIELVEGFESRSVR